jgi:hypothetical protein
MEGLADLRRVLPAAWKGFANFVMRQHNGAARTERSTSY